MNVQEQKKRLRREQEAKRSAIPLEERLDHSRMICRLALEQVLQPYFATLALNRKQAAAPPILFTYIPLRSEVEVTPILTWCWDQGIAVAAPRVVSSSRKMTLHIMRSYEDLEEGAYGIREPKPDVPELKDLTRVKLMLVPGLAFDAKMGRLGYGGGYYDRFMRRYAEFSGSEPFKLALAYDMQLIAQVPMADHDFRVDALVTETRVVHRML